MKKSVALVFAVASKLSYRDLFGCGLMLLLAFAWVNMLPASPTPHVIFTRQIGPGEPASNGPARRGLICKGKGCNGLDPIQYGCASDQRLVPGYPQPGIPYGYLGIAIYYSPSCSAYWKVITNYSSQSVSMPVTLKLTDGTDHTLKIVAKLANGTSGSGSQELASLVSIAPDEGKVSTPMLGVEQPVVPPESLA